MELEKKEVLQLKVIYRWNISIIMKTILNLIDTPGHVDFSYEVSRSIYSCEGALLIVDALRYSSTNISNLYLALEHDLEIIPVMNKIDLPSLNLS